MNVVENTFFKELRPLLGRQFFNAAQLIQQGVGIEGIDHAVDLGRRRLIDIFKKHYKRVATVFSRRTYQIFEESKKSIYPDSYEQIDLVIELKGPKNEFWNSIMSWSRIQMTGSIRNIQRTTKKTIAGIIKRGMADGESHREIAKRIRKTSAAINPHRSRTIALTETHKVAVKSVDTAVASTRIEMEREWVSAKDDRTRTRDKNNRFEHFRSFPAGADGEKVAQDGKFKGTGEALDYPGDSKGSAGNTIRCRCVLVYHSVKRTEQLKPHVPEEIPSFVPAKDVKEATIWAKQNIAKKVQFAPENFAPMDIEFANQINETVFSIIKEKKLDGIIYDSPLKISKLLGEDSIGKSLGVFNKNTLYIPINSNTMSEKAFKVIVKKGFDNAKKQHLSILSQLKAQYKYSGDKEILKIMRQVEKEGIKPWMISKTRKDTIIHEMGHWLEDQNKVLRKLSNIKTNPKVNDYIKLSEYQELNDFETGNMLELISEYFVAYKNNNLKNIPKKILKEFKK